MNRSEVNLVLFRHNASCIHLNHFWGLSTSDRKSSLASKLNSGYSVFMMMNLSTSRSYLKFREMNVSDEDGKQVSFYSILTQAKSGGTSCESIVHLVTY